MGYINIEQVMKDFQDDPTISDEELEAIEKFINKK